MRIVVHEVTDAVVKCFFLLLQLLSAHLLASSSCSLLSCRLLLPPISCFFGQWRAVAAVRFLVADSIEENMAELQGNKALISAGAVNASAALLAQLTVEDLRFLFFGNQS